MLSNKIIFKRGDLRSLGIDTVLVFSVDTLGFNSNHCDSPHTHYTTLFWRQNGRTYGQNLSCKDTSQIITPVTNQVIDYFFSNNINERKRKREIRKHLKKHPTGFGYNPVNLQTYYSLILYYSNKQHSSLLLSDDMASTLWQKFKTLKKEMDWCSLIMKAVPIIKENNGR